MMSLCGSNRLTSFSAAGTVSPLRTRRSVCSITCSTKGSQEPTEASQASTSMPAHAAALTLAAAHADRREPATAIIDTASSAWLLAAMNGLGTPLGPPAVIMPGNGRRLRQIAGGVQRGTMIRMASHKSQLSLGSWIIVSVTVLSRRSSVPVSTLVSLALANKQRLIRSQVRALIALIVSCRTDLRAPMQRRRAKARNDGSPTDETPVPGNSCRYCLSSAQRNTDSAGSPSRPVGLRPGRHSSAATKAITSRCA